MSAERPRRLAGCEPAASLRERHLHLESRPKRSTSERLLLLRVSKSAEVPKLILDDISTLAGYILAWKRRQLLFWSLSLDLDMVDLVAFNGAGRAKHVVSARARPARCLGDHTRPDQTSTVGVFGDSPLGSAKSVI